MRRRLREPLARRSQPRRARAESPSSSSTSCAVSTSFAPSRISLWQPFDNGEWIEPGIANTSRPCSPA